MLELYGELWQFKSVVESWPFSVNRSKDYIFLRHRVKDSGIFVNWSLEEKVSLVEQHQDKYVVITLQACNRSGKEINHKHSIVMHEDDAVGVFDLDNLMHNLHKGNHDQLAKDFHQRFAPWAKKNVIMITRRIGNILYHLMEHAKENVDKQSCGGQGRGQQM